MRRIELHEDVFCWNIVGFIFVMSSTFNGWDCCRDKNGSDSEIHDLGGRGVAARKGIAVNYRGRIVVESNVRLDSGGRTAILAVTGVVFDEIEDGMSCFGTRVLRQPIFHSPGHPLRRP